MDEIKDLTENDVQAAAASSPLVEDITDVASISAEERAAIKRLTPWALPNSPAARGMTASDVKPYFYEGLVGENHSLATFFNRLAAEVNGNLAKIRALFLLAKQAREELSRDLQQTDENAATIEDLVDTNASKIYFNEIAIQSLEESFADAEERVLSLGTTVSQMAMDIYNHEKDLEDIRDLIADDEWNIFQNAEDIAQNAADIAQNKRDIAQNKRDIAQNKSDIAQNLENIFSNIFSIDRDLRNINEGIRINEENIAENASRISKSEKRITNIEKGLPPERFSTDSGVAYVKNVPENALPYAAIGKIGGMTRKCTNLIPYPYYETTKTTNGITFTVNDDGSIKVKGTAVGNAVLYLVNSDKLSMISGNTYIPTTGSTDVLLMCNYFTSEGKGLNFTTSQIGAKVYPEDVYYDNIYLLVSDGKTVDATIYPMLNEGTTALPYEPYFEGLRSASVTEVESVGANLIPYPYYETTKTINGITFTDNGDGTITVNGTASRQTYFILMQLSKFPEGIYQLSGCPVGGGNSTNPQYFIYGNGFSSSTGDYGTGGTIKVSAGDSQTNIVIVIEQGKTVNNLVFRPMLNVGNVAYPYMPYAKHTLPIPEAVQTLDGYGWGLNDTCYNYIDFEKKQFVKRVQKVALDGLNNKVPYVNVYNGMYYASIVLSKNGINGASNLLIERFKEKEEPRLGNAYIASKTTLAIFHENQSLTTPDLWNDWLKNNNVTVCYELEQPEITDISYLISDDNLIKVEGGGSITMKNEYQYAVPSEITYQLKGVTQ